VSLGGFNVGGGSRVFRPIGHAAAGTALMMRVRGDVERARRELADRFAAVDPNMSEISTLETIARAETYIFGAAFWLTLALGSLALLLTLSGLFSVLSYLVEQRTREIGVRMALGASNLSVGKLVLLQCARPVGIGLAIGCMLTAGLGAALLATPAAEQIGGNVQLFDPVAYGASLLCIVAACAAAALVPALRAGRVNPLVALRQD
jgi:predicted lysophospholipase L1 biosynthesis ABC-type transport system permease subunit